MERRFLENLKSQSDNLGKFNLKFSPASVEETQKSSYIIDQMLIKGVKHNRDENDSNHDYMYVDTHENMGLRFYLHKYFLGFHPYYLEVKNQELMEKASKLNDSQPVQDLLKIGDDIRDSHFRMRKEMLQRSLSVVLRSTFLVRNFGKLEQVTGPDSMYDPAYSGNHIVIFEC